MENIVFYYIIFSHYSTVRLMHYLLKLLLFYLFLFIFDTFLFYYYFIVLGIFFKVA